MIQNTVIDRCLKSNFKAIEEQNNNRYILRWGKKDEVERIYKINEETGEPEFTGEIRETDWCTYETGIYKGSFSLYWLEKALEGRNRKPLVSEYKTFYDAMNLSEERQIPLLKEKLKEEIRRYDKSDAVEDFTIDGVHLWLNSDMRAKVRENLETAQHKDEEYVTLRYEGMTFPLAVIVGWQLYYAVLDYARATWDVTEIHLSNVDGLTGVAEILAYDYTTGYPEKLEF